jgi:hypothetical protein
VKPRCPKHRPSRPAVERGKPGAVGSNPTGPATNFVQVSFPSMEARAQVVDVAFPAARLELGSACFEWSSLEAQAMDEIVYFILPDWTSDVIPFVPNDRGVIGDLFGRNQGICNHALSKETESSSLNVDMPMPVRQYRLGGIARRQKVRHSASQ